MSQAISLSGTSSILKATFYPPLELQGEYGIGLIDFHTFNSIPNVNEANNKITIGKRNLEIPTGTWEIDELNTWINNALKSKSSDKDVFYLQGNLNTMKCEMRGETDAIDLSSPTSIAPLLGFHRKIYSAGKKHESQLPVQISGAVEDIRIQCSVATGSFDNNRPSNIVYAFYPDVPPGFKIIQRPSTIIYYPLNTNTISEITVCILDHKNRLIDFRGERITLRLHLNRQ